MWFVINQRHLYLLYCLYLLGLLVATYHWYKKYTIREVTHEPGVQTNLNCYYSVEGDALSSAEDLKFSSGDNIIFFHETSCRNGIDSRQACCIESAARLHPKWQVNLLFTAPITQDVLNRSQLTFLLQFPNVKLSRVHIVQYSEGTIVEEIVTEELNESDYLMQHTADILRILTLHKFGGVYLDTDSLLIKDLDSLPPNWIGKQSHEDLATGAMRFSKRGIGAEVMGEILREISKTFSPESWSYNGPEAIQRALVRFCPDELKVYMVSDDCEGIQIFSENYFYPVYFYDTYKYFKNGTIDTKNETYMHHMWNFLSKDMEIESDSPYAKLAKKFCPTIYEKYGEDFGVVGKVE